MVSIKYEDISVAYDDFIVVENLNLDIHDGEITTLLGPSGCGKTTVLRCLAGFVDPYHGKVYMGDKDITLLPPQVRNTAMIFQNYALWPHLTIFKNVEYGLKLRLKEKIVYIITIDDKDSLEDVKLSSYGSPEYILKAAEVLETISEGKTSEEAWNLTWADLLASNEELSSIPERKGIYVIGALRKAIRFHYEIVKKSLPEWLPEKKTSLEKKKVKKPFHLHFFWITKPYYWLVKTKYMDAKAKVDNEWNFRREKVNEVLKLVHLEDQAEKHPTELSGGQQQRIALARSIVVEPDVLLCDEPLSNLDAKLRTELRTEIRSIIKEIGMTAVYVTHDQIEALAISDRIAILHEGDIQQYGTPTEVFTDPHTLFVAEFIGTSSTFTGKMLDAKTVELKGGEKITINTKKVIPADTDVSIVIRPENVSLTSVNDNPIDFEINTIEYLGTEVKMTGKLKDNSILLIDVAEQAEKYAKMNVGEKLTAYISTEEIFVFIGDERIY